MIKRVTFMSLRVEDMDAMRRFFTETLGLSVNPQETVEGFYTQFDIPSVATLSLIRGLDDLQEQRYDLALLVENADEAYALWKSNGVEMVTEPRDIPWGRTFLFRTPEGHVLRVYSAQSG